MRGAVRKKKPGHEFDVIVTSYTYFEREGCEKDRHFLCGQEYACVVYDEAHAIKNLESSRYKRLVKMSTKRRLLMSVRRSFSSMTCLCITS